MRARLCPSLAVTLVTNSKQQPKKKRKAKNSQAFMKQKPEENAPGRNTTPKKMTFAPLDFDDSQVADDRTLDVANLNALPQAGF